MQSNRSSHPLLSCADGVAVAMSDTLVLLSRLLIAALFLLTVWYGSPNTAYLQSINFVAPEMMGLRRPGPPYETGSVHARVAHISPTSPTRQRGELSRNPRWRVGLVWDECAT